MRYFSIKIPRPEFVDKIILICLFPLMLCIPLIAKIQRYRWNKKPDSYKKRKMMLCLDADNSLKAALALWWRHLKK